MLAEYLPHYSVDDYLHWEGDWELIDGIAYAMSPKPVKKHQLTGFKVMMEFTKNLKNCQKCKVFQEVDWRVSSDTVLSPDVLLVCNESIEGQFVENTPEIIFEILSPSTEKNDRFVKYEIYREAGVKYYILVDIKKESVEVFELQNKKYSKVLESRDEVFEFSFQECQIDFDFSEIWS